MLSECEAVLAVRRTATKAHVTAGLPEVRRSRRSTPACAGLLHPGGRRPAGTACGSTAICGLGGRPAWAQLSLLPTSGQGRVPTRDSLWVPPPLPVGAHALSRRRLLLARPRPASAGCWLLAAHLQRRQRGAAGTRRRRRPQRPGKHAHNLAVAQRCLQTGTQRDKVTAVNGWTTQRRIAELAGPMTPLA